MKYRLTDEFQHIDGHILHRIECIAPFVSRGIQINEGTLGGWVEMEFNLSQTGECWISADSYVMGISIVSGNALIDGGSIVIDSIIDGTATVCNSLINGSSVHENASAIDSNLTSSFMNDESYIRGVDIFGASLLWNTSVNIDSRQSREGHWESRLTHTSDVLRQREYMENIERFMIERGTPIGNDVEERQ